MDLKIGIATHKKFERPQEDFFLPIQVGSALNDDLGYQGDDEGMSISKKNPNYCELTALYWLWKNDNSKFLGLSHYRRYFDIENKEDHINDIRYISEEEFQKKSSPKEKIHKYLSKYDIILPKPKVYELSVEKVYGYSHSVIDYEILTQVLEEMYPEYKESWCRFSHLNNKLIHYNMFIASREIMDDYCTWLFDILFEVEKRVKISPYTYDQRVFGFMSERLMHLYFTHHNFKIKYLPILYVKDESFQFSTPSKFSKFLTDTFKNFLFFMSTLHKRV